MLIYITNTITFAGCEFIKGTTQDLNNETLVNYLIRNGIAVELKQNQAETAKLDQTNKQRAVINRKTKPKVTVNDNNS